MKRITCLFIAAVMLALCSCAARPAGGGDRPRVIASLFPQYDFVRQVAGEDVEVELLLPPGADSHTFDPGAKDVERIYSSQMFVYTGDYMEPWAGRLISGAKGELNAVDASAGVKLEAEEHGEDGHEHAGEEPDHVHVLDPHIWLDPTLAMVMVDNITEGLCGLLPERADAFRENAEAYKKELKKLDDDTFEVVKNGKRDTLCFAGRFSYHYYLERYGLKYRSAFDSCSTESEPSLRSMTELCEFIKENKIPCVYHEELSEPKIAKTVAAETGASCELFSTGHNVTKQELDSGVTFLDVMRGNLERVRKGLN